MHYIQKYILDKLIYAKTLRNRDMRPPHTESNLYQYHLKRLVDSGYIEHSDEGYTLSGRGLQYADKHSADLKETRPQPKLITILLLENEAGEVLLVPRKKQPFIDMYNLPSGKIHEGESLLEAGQRELVEKAGITDTIELMPSGTVHLTITDDAGEVISESYGFILRGRVEDYRGNVMYDRAAISSNILLMPGVSKVVSSRGVHEEIRVAQNTTKC